MRWSQLKTQVESHFAPSVKGRVHFHMTGYRMAFEERGRGWITVDQQEIASFCDFTDENFQRNLGKQISPGQWPFSAATHEAARQSGFLSRLDYSKALREYLSSSIEDLLQSPNPNLRALGMLDRRLGKRRLRVLTVANQPEFVHALFRFRCAAEGIHLGEKTT